MTTMLPRQGEEVTRRQGEPLARIARACAAMPPATARRVLTVALHAPLMCAAPREKQSAADRALAKRHWELRQPVIAEFKAVVRRWFTKAKREALAQVRSLGLRQLAAAFGTGGLPPRDSASLALQSGGKPPQSMQASANAAPRLRDFALKDQPLLCNTGLGVSILFDPDRWRDGLLAEVRGELSHTLDTAGSQFFEEIGRDDVWMMPSPKAVRFLGQREHFIRDAAGNAGAELNGTVRAAIQESLARGDSQAKMVRNITSRFDDVSESRATTWANTEVGAAYGAARHEAAVEAGIGFKRWVCSFDNSRAWHEHANFDERNQRVPVEEGFFVNNGHGVEERLLFPGDGANGSPDNVINCHCLEIAVSEHDDGSGDGRTRYEREGLFQYDAAGNLTHIEGRPV